MGKTINRLNFYIETMDISIDEVANLCGTNKNTVTKWINGTATPSIEACLTISERIGVKVDDIWRLK